MTRQPSRKRSQQSGTTVPSRPESPLTHRALARLEPRESPASSRTPLREAAAHLTDRQRAGVLLQGVAVLSHLQRSRQRLCGGWSDGALDGRRRLVGLSAEAAGPQDLAAVLPSLLITLFGSANLVGRGAARRAVRAVIEPALSHQLLAPGPDSLLGDLIREATFLVEDEFAEDRVALMATALVGGRREVWVAGPPQLRRRVLGGRADTEEIARRLRSGDLFFSPKQADPVELERRGLWHRAIERWRVAPPDTIEEKVSLARCLFATGRFKRALVVLEGLGGPPVELVRVGCQHQLGELNAADYTLRQLEAATLEEHAFFRAANVAIRVLANLGQKRRLGRWLTRARSARWKEHQAHVHLLTAEAAWDAGDLNEMREELGRAMRTVSDVDSASWYFRTHALLLINEGRGEEARTAMETALRLARRQLLRFDAGRWWNDVMRARALTGDLAGAERAQRHGVRLLAGCDGDLGVTLGLTNLAELRIRRGRMNGVEEILKQAGTLNRRAGNKRGQAEDLELRVRLLLARGELEEGVRLALEGISDGAVEWQIENLRALAARGLGWLGRVEEAAACLPSEVPPLVFEPEEVPGLLALAGRQEDSITLVRGGEGLAHRVWHGVLVAGLVDTTLLDAFVRGLEPYRAARLMFDIELVKPGCMPTSYLRRALHIMGESGAPAWVARVERSLAGTWAALADFLAGDRAVEAVERLLRAVGLPEAELVVIPSRGGPAVTIVAGVGGEHVHRSRRTAGEWILRCSGDSARVRAVFQVLANVLIPPQPSGESPPQGVVVLDLKMKKIWARLERLARQELSILILGETGTGKEVAALEVHRKSRRKEGPFLAINCAALSESLGLSDLFGHVKGAFTGADRDRAGVFESAAQGTVFLDEVGDLPPAAQGMLLRVLQESEVRRLGESRSRRVDVRVVAATNRDLRADVEQGRFREDLYYRLAVGVITLPPLRERGDDVLALADRFVAELGDGRIRLSPEARERLGCFGWPGNVRQLRNTIQRSSAVCSEGLVRLEDLELGDGRPEERWQEWLDRLKRERLRDELDRAGGNQAAAARRLGLTRQALSYLVKQLGLS